MRGRRRSWRQDVKPVMKVEGVSYSPVSKYSGVILHLEATPPPAQREDALGPPGGPRVLLRQGRPLPPRTITIAGACQPTAALSRGSRLARPLDGDSSPARGPRTVSGAVSESVGILTPERGNGGASRLTAPRLGLPTLDGRPGIGLPNGRTRSTSVVGLEPLESLEGGLASNPPTPPTGGRGVLP